MRADERRIMIANKLLSESRPVSGGELSALFGASRQIIVQDIALLRASGYDIISTHSGYIVKSSPLCERVFKVRHTGAETEDELARIVMHVTSGYHYHTVRADSEQILDKIGESLSKAGYIVPEI